MASKISRLVGAVALFGVLLVGVPASAGGGKVKIGEAAPDFSMVLVDGSKVSLADLRGKVVVLNFWATWCVPCRKELPLLDTYYAAQRDAGLRVFAVTTEDSLPLSQMKKLFAVMRIPAVKRIKGPYDWIGGVPTNIVIGRDGKIRYAKAGSFDLDALNAILVPLLREPVPAVTG
ncbi:MAG: redoxin domain-containing protein [Pseudomonadota bacterium]